MNTAAKGRKNEYRSIEILEAAGYWCTRAAASKGPVDIVGIGKTGVVLVQVKSNRWPDPAEMEALSLLPTPDNCRVIIHRWRDRQRLPDVKEI